MATSTSTSVNPGSARRRNSRWTHGARTVSPSLAPSLDLRRGERRDDAGSMFSSASTATTLTRQLPSLGAHHHPPVVVPLARKTAATFLSPSASSLRT